MLSVVQGAQALKEGRIIAYPTEAVFGLGCCPQNIGALNNILTLKARAPQKGMILIASHLQQLLPYIDVLQVPQQRMQHILQTWPGPFTWVFPVTSLVSSLIKGQFETVAVRVTKHPIAKALCEAFGGAIVSTSANISSEEPIREATKAFDLFKNAIAGVVEGEVGDLAQPTSITDAITGQKYR
ncbi:MAG: Sua5/YciO/YrdC/YwlC family protein [Proteobacteria bacterium]|nr:Sua5/YciO/YrdC/YwlC family protein [Pseudomonadota bacterium]